MEVHHDRPDDLFPGGANRAGHEGVHFDPLRVPDRGLDCNIDQLLGLGIETVKGFLHLDHVVELCGKLGALPLEEFERVLVIHMFTPLCRVAVP